MYWNNRTFNIKIYFPVSTEGTLKTEIPASFPPYVLTGCGVQMANIVGRAPQMGGLIRGPIS
jgi:hypothetical protein